MFLYHKSMVTAKHVSFKHTMRLLCVLISSATFTSAIFSLDSALFLSETLTQIIRSVWTSTCRAQIFSSSSSDCWAHTDGGSRPSLVPVLIPVCRVLVPAARDLVPAQDLLLYRPDQSEHCGSVNQQEFDNWMDLALAPIKNLPTLSFLVHSPTDHNDNLLEIKERVEGNETPQNEDSVFIQIRILFANNMLCRD